MSEISWDYIPTPEFEPTPLRLLAPIRAPDPSSTTRHLPSPPYPPTKPPQHVPYVLTTHVIPAALPRTSPDVPVPSIPRGSTRDERRESNAKILNELDQHWDKYFDDELGGKDTDSEQEMVNAVNRYVHHDLLHGQGTPRVSRERGLTLIFAHANGFPKEIWEPTIERLLSSPNTAALVDEVWVWEGVQHGDSCLLNAAQLGGLFSWHDNARDIANFLLHYLPSTSGGVLPTHLTPVSPTESQKREVHGFSNRTIVPTSHSYGGCSTAFAAITFPALFDSIIFVDPVIVMPGRYRQQNVDQLARGAISRREEWSSREEALASFQASPFKVWHPSVLETYCQRGIHYPTDEVDSPEGSGSKTRGRAKLKTPGVQEAIVFVDRTTPGEVFQLLPLLDKRIELRWVMPGRTEAEIGGPGHGNILCWRRPENSSNVRIAKAGHLIAQEAPHELADEIAAFLGRKYSLSGETLQSRL